MVQACWRGAGYFLISTTAIWTACCPAMEENQAALEKALMTNVYRGRDVQAGRTRSHTGRTYKERFKTIFSMIIITFDMRFYSPILLASLLDYRPRRPQSAPGFATVKTRRL